MSTLFDALREYAEIEPAASRLPYCRLHFPKIQRSSDNNVKGWASIDKEINHFLHPTLRDYDRRNPSPKRKKQ